MNFLKSIFPILPAILILISISCSSDDEETCDDGILNGNEEMVDCGGNCPPCPSCDNGIQDGNETGVDCGGDCDYPCHCYNGVTDANEYCTDCGGDCEDCNSSGRYIDNVFSSYESMTDEDFSTMGISMVYGRNTFPSEEEVDLELTIFEPDGDSESSRPVVIMLGGTPLYQLPNDGQVMTYARSMVGKGYVVAMVDTRYYDLGTVMTFNEQLDALFKARADLLAAIRYMRKESAALGIDTDNIWLLGYSGGGLISLYAAFLDENDASDLDAATLSILEENGGYEGDSGNAEYDSSVKGVISLAGFMLHDELVEEGEALLFSIIGSEDPIHPQGAETMEVDWVTEPFLGYGPEAYHFGLTAAELKIINGGDVFAPIMCCVDEIAEFIGVRFNCD